MLKKLYSRPWGFKPMEVEKTKNGHPERDRLTTVPASARLLCFGAKRMATKGRRKKPREDRDMKLVNSFLDHFGDRLGTTGLGTPILRLEKETIRLDSERFREFMVNTARRQLGFLPNSRELTRIKRALADEARAQEARWDFPPEIQERVNELPHVQVLLEYMENKAREKLKVGDWFKELNKLADKYGIDRKQKAWLKVPWTLGRFFRDEQALLVAVGLLCSYEEPKKEDGRWVTITTRDREEDGATQRASEGASEDNLNPSRRLGKDDAPEGDKAKLLEQLKQRRP